MIRHLLFFYKEINGTIFCWFEEQLAFAFPSNDQALFTCTSRFVFCRFFFKLVQYWLLCKCVSFDSMSFTSTLVDFRTDLILWFLDNLFTLVKRALVFVCKWRRFDKSNDAIKHFWNIHLLRQKSLVTLANLKKKNDLNTNEANFNQANNSMRDVKKHVQISLFTFWQWRSSC